MAQWNDTDEPLAYLLTFRAYGTWLAGDERGSIDRFHKIYGRPRAVASAKRKEMCANRLKSPPFVLNATSRKLVDDAIREVCQYRDWKLTSIKVRTNHVHVIVAASAASGKMVDDFKSYSTRRLRESGEWKHSHSPWVDHGSCRLLWTAEHVTAATDHVINVRAASCQNLISQNPLRKRRASISQNPLRPANELAWRDWQPANAGGSDM